MYQLFNGELPGDEVMLRAVDEVFLPHEVVVAVVGFIQEVGEHRIEVDAEVVGADIEVGVVVVDIILITNPKMSVYYVVCLCSWHVMTPHKRVSMSVK
jgi:hypothetical protein